LKIQDSRKILTPKMTVHLGVCWFIPSHSKECKYDFRVAFRTRTFLCLCFGREPKAKVMIHAIFFLVSFFIFSLYYPYIGSKPKDDKIMKTLFSSILDEIPSSPSFLSIKYVFRKPFKKGFRQWMIWNLPKKLCFY